MARFSIGIAGYMGSGKTTCTRALAAHKGFFVMDGDSEARRIMQQSMVVHRQLLECFGEDIVENGALSFKKLGARVFADLRELRKLNAIVHPLLLERLRKTIFEKGAGIVVVDAALLPLWNIEDWFDLRIWIDASFDTRLDRLLRKGLGLAEAEIRTRMVQQEALFAPPAAESWMHVVNEGDSGALGETVRSYVHKSIGGI